MHSKRIGKGTPFRQFERLLKDRGMHPFIA